MGRPPWHSRLMAEEGTELGIRAAAEPAARDPLSAHDTWCLDEHHRGPQGEWLRVRGLRQTALLKSTCWTGPHGLVREDGF